MSYLLNLSSRTPIRGLPQTARMISTTLTKLHSHEKLPEYKGVKDFSAEAVEKSKDWVSYGWDRRDKTHDRNMMKSTFFLSITLCMVVGMTVWAYAPDRLLKDWACREAFLVLREREAAGLDPIDPDYFTQSKITLPTDEELGDVEIII